MTHRFRWILAGALVLSRCAPEDSRRPSSVVLVTIDTLRADHVGTGTPHLEALAREGALFTNAVAQSPLTLPSHSSILTGTNPTNHGVRDNGRYRLPEESVTLAELLKEAGYETAAFVGAFPVDSRFGLAQGFDRYDDSFSRSPSRVGFAERRASEVVDAASRWLREKPGKLSFAWIHLFDPHAPYEPPSPFPSNYGGEVAYTDAALGELLRGLDEETLIIVTADHGEGLDEHGERTHSLFVYDSTLKVPLILKGPGVPRGSTIREQVRSIDVLPTILDLVGKEGACAECEGRSLVPAFREEALPDLPSYAETYFPRLNLGWSELRSLRRGGWKYIAAPEPELYDLASDPGETRNLALSNRGKVEELAAELDRFGEPVEIETAQPLDSETLSLLRSLGYMSVAKPPVAAAGADPKARLHVWEAVRAGMESLAQGRTAEAIRELESALRGEPELVLARSYLAAGFFEGGRYSDAAEQCGAILEQDPEDFDATLLLARSLLRIGHVAEAKALMARAAEIDPASPAPWVELAALHWQRRAPVEAKAALEKARGIDESHPGVLVMRGKLAVAAGALSDAEDLFRRVLEMARYEEESRVQLGNVLLMQKRFAETEALFREGLEIHPESVEFHLGLGHARALSGKPELAVPLFEKALQIEPDSTMALNSLGFALLEMGKTAEGLARLRRSLTLSPDQPELRNLVESAKK